MYTLVNQNSKAIPINIVNRAIADIKLELLLLILWYFIDEISSEISLLLTFYR